MRHGSLFSGIGGFDLAAEWMGWENIFHCEWNQFGQKILKHYWPNSISYGDITKTDFTIHRGEIDILTGGFPCQPYSLAGKRKGKEDDRHLWPEMLRAIREIQPGWIVGENVYGLINWSGGLVFHEVQADLEAEGYEVFPYVLPACAVNAPHRRDRVWFVAYRKKANSGNRLHTWSGRHGVTGVGNVKSTSNTQHNGHPSPKIGQGMGEGNDNNQTGQESGKQSKGLCEQEFDANTGKIGLSGSQSFGELARKRRPAICYEPNVWEKFPTQSPICSGDDGIPTGLDGVTVSKHRKESLMAYGNAVVPQVVYQIFKSIELYEKNIHPGLPQPKY